MSDSIFDDRGVRAVVIPNPVPESISSGSPSDGIIDILIVARHSVEKDLATAIRAIVGLPGRRLQLIGRGDLTPELRRLVLELGVDNRVDFIGGLDAGGVREAMRAARVVLLPSRWEAMPMVTLESVAEDADLVVSDIPAHQFLKDAGAALTHPPGDPQGLASAVESLNDPGVKDSLRKGRAIVRSNQSEEAIALLWDETARNASVRSSV